MYKDCIQYLSNPFTKWRIYRVYIAPVIDWFLPVVFGKRKHDLQKANDLESFQHKCLCDIFNATINISRTGLEKAVGERSILLKTQVLASRLAKYVSRKDNEMRRGTDALNESIIQMNLRGGGGSQRGGKMERRR